MTQLTDKSKQVVRISVRSLVEFLLRSGDITGGGTLADREAMQAGSRIHRMIQRRRGGAYRAEVALKAERACVALPIGPDEQSGPQLPYTLVVEGRADGIDEDPDGVIIEEIKGIYADPESLESPDPVHLAQAKCYAAIYGTEHALATVRIRMTYCHLETETILCFDSTYEVAELVDWFASLCDEYEKWAGFRIAWQDHRDRTIGALTFPFTFRTGQRDMVASVYASIRDQKNLFAQAPTGVGKTMSVLYPAIRAMEEGRVEKIFYLTAKTITRTVAEEAFSILAEQGLACKALTITAKEKICPMEVPGCDPAHCPFAMGHYDRINEALYAYLTTGSSYDRESLLAVSAQHQVCPYELQRDLAGFVDAVICDYNYAFDPSARLGAYFGDTAKKGNYLLLIDEAHNLAERGREMFSATLERRDLLRVRRLLSAPEIKENKQIRKLRRAIGRCCDILRDYRDEAEEMQAESERGSGVSEEMAVVCSYVEALIAPLISLAGQLEEFLMRRNEEESGQRTLFTPAEHARGDMPGDAREELLELYFSVRFFLAVYEELDEHYLIYGVTGGRSSYRIKLFCVDPSAALQEVIDRCVCAVFFSATLLPVCYYERLLTTRTDNYEIYIPSPFDQTRRTLQIGVDVTTRYTSRGAELYARIAEYIASVCGAKVGNYMVYFPSYRMLEDVLDVIRSTEQHVIDNAELHVQRPGMREADREAFLEAFSSSDANTTRIGLCVMGGIFAEGIDLAGDRLIGVIVVGTGLPQVGAERELLKQYHDARGENGFDFAYRNPGMNKVLQAAGRVIRTPEDVGVIALLDERFLAPAYRALFPREWADANTVTRKEVTHVLTEFWAQTEA